MNGVTQQQPVAGGPAGEGPFPSSDRSRRSGRSRPGRTRRPDESMTLLREVMERPLDPGYATAAARQAGGAPPRGRSVTLVVALVCGLVVTWSVSVLRAPAPEAVKAREVLVQQIQGRTKANDAAKVRIAADREAVRRAQSRALTNSGDEQAAATAAALGVVSGEVPVTGPGVRITLDDAPGSRGGAGANGDPRSNASTDDGRVFDRDLQTIVNGLWAIGAEAIAINGQRLTALSAIRSAGQAVLVDFRPLVPPYVIDAVGDEAKLQTRFVDSAAGAYLQSLQDNFGVKAGIEAERDLKLPGSGSLVLRLARPSPASSSGAGPSATDARGSTTSDPPSAIASTATRPSPPEASQ